jgi:hypothetical protein
MAEYVKVAHAADLPAGQAMTVTVGEKRIALFSVDGTSPSTIPARTGADLFQRES